MSDAARIDEMRERYKGNFSELAASFVKFQKDAVHQMDAVNAENKRLRKIVQGMRTQIQTMATILGMDVNL
jgi:sigma54-dependent transcription regulator